MRSPPPEWICGGHSRCSESKAQFDWARGRDGRGARREITDGLCSSDGIFESVGHLAIYKPGQLAAEFGL
jgi:hypothetical protein